VSDKTNIAWCDATFNPWIGCTKVSPGCAHCYAEKSTPVRTWGIEWGKGRPRNRTTVTTWRKPLSWDTAAGRHLFVECSVCGGREFRKWDNRLPPGGLSCCGTSGCLALPETEMSVVRPRVFCGSLCDWLDDEVPIQWMADLLDLICRTPKLDWLLLTKRPENWNKRMVGAQATGSREDGLSMDGPGPETGHCVAYDWLHNLPPSNVWLGVSAEDQQRWDERVPALLSIPAAKRFVSVEPMLGPIEMCDDEVGRNDDNPRVFPGIDWIIFGGESGPNARSCNIEWIRDGVRQCREVGAVPFVKQLGARPVNSCGVSGVVPLGTLPHMRPWEDPAEWPDDLRVREWPV
jgi:protein gp37